MKETKKNEKEEKRVEKEKEWYSITCLLENFSKARMEIPEENFEAFFEALEQAIKSEEFFNADEYGGTIEVSGMLIDALNCKKVLGYIY